MPLSWLAEHADIAELEPDEVAAALVRVGLEVERVEPADGGITGELVVGRVVDIEQVVQKNGKRITFCSVDLGGAQAASIVCGATNFVVGDHVVVARPGAMLPGGFEIVARKVYGRVSEGMMCSARELGVGDDDGGIIVLPEDAPGRMPGTDARVALGLDDTVLTVAVTPDRGYCLSVRGMARDLALALGRRFTDVMAAPTDGDVSVIGVVIDAPDGCDMFSIRTVSGLDPARPSPTLIRRRLQMAGLRPRSLAVDVTNYVMLETGQPLHAFDYSRVRGDLRARRAVAGETLSTLDGVERILDPDDMVVADETGVLALAGVMGGASSEIGPETTEVLLEAAHWDAGSTARTARRHRLITDAGRRFERGVDPQIAAVALQRCVDLLVQHGSVTTASALLVTGTGPQPRVIEMAADHPARLSGRAFPRSEVLDALRKVGCDVVDADPLVVTPPSWRPDLTIPAELVEDVLRVVGYDTIPPSLPAPPPGRGLTSEQRLRRAVSRALSSAGATEIYSSVFLRRSVADELGLPPDDPRRAVLTLANPLSQDEPQLRTTLLPGLFTAVKLNLSRGERDLVLFEMGVVFRARPDAVPVIRPATTHAPSAAERAELDAALPDQPRHIAAVLTGKLERASWWGPGRNAVWADAVELARAVATAARVEVSVERGAAAPWHPGRCAAITLDGVLLGHAGELHPRVVATLGLPERTCAMELDLGPLDPPEPVPAPAIPKFPPVLIDVALVVPDEVPAAAVLDALREGAGPLLDSIQLFDVYSGLAAGRSLAFTLRFRGHQRTLTMDDAIKARDAAIARATELTGAKLRS